MYFILQTPTFSFWSGNILIVKGLHSITVDSSPSASLSQRMLLQSELHSTDMNQMRWSKAQGVCRYVRKILDVGKSSLKVWRHKTRASPIFATSQAQIWNKTGLQGDAPIRNSNISRMWLFISAHEIKPATNQRRELDETSRIKTANHQLKIRIRTSFKIRAHQSETVLVFPDQSASS